MALLLSAEVKLQFRDGAYPVFTKDTRSELSN